MGDPTHVRIITPQVMTLFSRANCDIWKSQGASNTPLAHYLDVDFETVSAEVKLDEPYASALRSGQLRPEDANTLLRERNNIATEFVIDLRVIKT
jgi:IS30 family transposase